MALKGPAPGQERLVVSRLRFLGDVVLSTPALEALREARPHAWIDYLTYPAFAPVLEHHPAVDRVLTLPPNAGAGPTLALVRTLRTPRVEWFFDLLSNPRSATHVALARPRVSVGQKAGPRSLVYSHRRPKPEGSQIAAHLDRLVPLVGLRADTRPRVYVTEAERTTARQRFFGAALLGTIAIHPGASWPWRLWPRERWPLLIEVILAAYPGVRVLLVTPPGEDAPLHPSPSDPTRVDVLPVLGIRELMAVLSQTQAYVGNDGGVLHTTVALGVPTVGLFGGENDPGCWFPYSELGPFRSILASSAETLPDGKGRHFPRPDATVPQVMTALTSVYPPPPA